MRSFQTLDGISQDAGVEAELPCCGEPPLIAGELLGTLGSHQVASLEPLKIGIEFPLKTLPHSYALHHKRHLGRIAALLTDKPPRTARLFRRNLTFLADNDCNSALGEAIGSGSPDDAAADNRDNRFLDHPSNLCHWSGRACLAMLPV